MAADMQAEGVPGFAIAVVAGGQIAWAKGFGVTSIEEGGVLVTPDTVFRIGSNTKPLTGTMIMRLVEQGMLNLDTPVRHYVPWFALSEPGAADRVTLRLLLTHRTGLPSGGDFMGSRNPDGLEAYVREIVPGLPLGAAPGTVYSYSNHNTNIAGYVAEAVTGRRFADLMQELLFKPLGMTRTTFDPLVACTYPLAQIHEKDAHGVLRVAHQQYENVANYPSYFAFSTVTDLARFALMRLQRGRVGAEQLLRPESVAEMERVQADWMVASGGGGGLACVVEPYRGTTRVWHTGAVGSYRSTLLMAPAEGVAVVTLANTFFGWDQAAMVFDDLLRLAGRPAETVTPPSTIEPDRDRWPSYVGQYLGLLKGHAEVVLGGDDLVLIHNGVRSKLSLVREDVYLTEAGASVGFLPGYVLIDGKPCARLDRAEPYQPDQAHWAPLTGTYSNGVVTFWFGVEEGQPVLRDDEDEVVCFPVGPDTFVAPGHGLIEIQPGEDGRLWLHYQRGWHFPRQ